MYAINDFCGSTQRDDYLGDTECLVITKPSSPASWLIIEYVSAINDFCDNKSVILLTLNVFCQVLVMFLT